MTERKFTVIGDALPATHSAVETPEVKVENGKTYVKVAGKWVEKSEK